MNNTHTFIGNQRLFSLLKQRKEQENGNHAYCLVGQEHCGKTTMVMHLAAYFLETTIQKVPVHPDFLHLTQEINVKTKKTKKHIDVEQIRSAKHIVNTKPFVGKYRIVFIESAERMNTNAANDLLKTLEEPASGNLIFLTTKNNEALTQTILSRCQTYHLTQTPTLDIANHLNSVYGVDQDIAMQKAKESRGLPGLAINWARDDDAYTTYKKYITQFHALAGEPFFQKIKDTEELFGDKTDHIKDRQRLVTILEYWQLVLHDYAQTLSKKSTSNIYNLTPHKDWTYTAIGDVYDRIEQAKKLLHKNIHPRLLIETILLTIP